MPSVTSLGDGSVTVDGLRLAIGEWDGEPTVDIDPDEVTVTGTIDGCTVAVRHHLDTHWDVRITVTNDTDIPRYPRLRLFLDGLDGWAWFAGAEGLCTIRGETSWWVGKTRQGTIADAGAVDDPHYHCEPIIAPGECLVGVRMVTVLRLSPLQSMADAVAHLPDWLPERLCVGSDDEIRFPLPDQALSTPNYVDTEVDDDGTTTLSSLSGWAPVTIQGARGTTTFRVGWAQPVADYADGLAARFISAYRLDRDDAAPLPLAVADVVVVGSVLSPWGSYGEELLFDHVLGGGIDTTVDDAERPLLVTAWALLAARTGDDLLANKARTEIARLSAVPGALAAIVKAVVLLGSDGVDLRDCDQRLAELVPGIGGLEAAILLGWPHRDEVLRQVRRASGELGWGLPGAPLGVSQRDVVALRAGLLSQTDITFDDLPHPPAWVGNQRLLELCVGAPQHSWLAWMLLGRISGI